MADEPLPRTVEEQGLEDALKKGTDNMDPPATEAEIIERIVRRRPGQIVPISISFKFTVHHIGDALVTDGEKLYELGQGTWRLVSEEVYDRVFKAALVAPASPAEAVRRRRKH